MAKAYLSILLLLFCIPVYGAELVIGISHGQLVRPDDGKHWDHSVNGGWEMYESDYSPMWSIGLRFPVTERFGVEARYHDWGKYAQFLGSYPHDTAYEAGLVTEPCAPDCRMTRWAYNEGRARGFTLTGTYEAPLAGKLRLFTRLGVAYVMNDWYYVSVYGDDPWKRHFDNRQHYYDNAVSATAGLGFSYGNVRLEYAYVHDLESKPAHCCSPHQQVRAVSLSFVF